MFNRKSQHLTLVLHNDWTHPVELVDKQHVKGRKCEALEKKTFAKNRILTTAANQSVL